MKQVTEGQIASRRSQVKSNLSLVQRAGVVGSGAQVAFFTSVSGFGLWGWQPPWEGGSISQE